MKSVIYEKQNVIEENMRMEVVVELITSSICFQYRIYNNKQSCLIPVLHLGLDLLVHNTNPEFKHGRGNETLLPMPGFL